MKSSIADSKEKLLKKRNKQYCRILNVTTGLYICDTSLAFTVDEAEAMLKCVSPEYQCYYEIVEL